MESVYDPRDYDWAEKDVFRWRTFLRARLFDVRKGRSDLTLRSVSRGFDVHEGLIPRRLIPHSVSWQWMIFSSINCMMLLSEEHYPLPPSRIEAYWLSCVRHGKEVVDNWVDSLPWKVPLEKPWRRTHGWAVVQAMKNKYPVTSEWETFYLSPRAAVELNKYDEKV